MAYRLTLTDDASTKNFDILEIPIIDEDIEGASDTTVLNGDIFTDYLYLKKRYQHSWVVMLATDYAELRGFYTRQFTYGKFPTYTLKDMIDNTVLVDSVPVKMSLTDGGVIDECGTRKDVKIVMRESTND